MPGRERAVVTVGIAVAFFLEVVLVLLWIRLPGPRHGYSVPLVAVLLLPPCLLNGWRLVETIGAKICGPAAPLPRVEVASELGGKFKTVVVYPVLVADSHDLDQIVECVRQNRRIGPDKEVGHLIAADCQDRSNRSVAEEQRLHAELHQRIRSLMQESELGPVGALVRKQKLEPVSGNWMGWERKRGNLLELCDVASSGDPASYWSDPMATAVLSDARYLMVLDNGTLLHPRTIRELVGVLAGEPAENERTAIAQPAYRIVPPADPSWYLRIFLAGFVTPGSQPQPTQFSFMQWMLGRDRYGGQALIAVEPFLQCLRGKIADNAVLSHDKLEGTYAKTQFVGDAVILGKAIRSFLVLRRRQVRWIRGDVQLLPWLVGRQAPPGGLRPWDRMAMVLDIAVFAVDVSALCLVLLAWAVLSGPTALIVGLAAPVLAGGRFIPMLVAEALPGFRGLRAFGTRLRRSLLIECVQFILLADRAVYTASAIAVSLWRVSVTHRNLLQWQPRAMAARALARHPRTRWVREMWPGAALSAVVACWFAVRGAPSPIVYVVLGFWFLAPLVAAGLSLPARRPTIHRVGPGQPQRVRQPRATAR